MDTSTIRLVIFLGMFLIFAGDYSALISSIFGNSTEKNKTAVKRSETLEGPYNEVSALSKKEVEKNNGKNKNVIKIINYKKLYYKTTVPY